MNMRHHPCTGRGRKVDCRKGFRKWGAINMSYLHKSVDEIHAIMDAILLDLKK